MSKIVEGVFTLQRINEAINLIEQDMYVTMDSRTAFEIIKKTILTVDS